MWRAWGIILLALSPQDPLGTRVSSPDHEFAFRPPAGWVRHVGAGPTLAKFVQPGDLKLPGELLVTHLHSTNPTPLESFKKQAKDNIKEKIAGAKILNEQDLTLGGKGAYRVMYTYNDTIQMKTVVHRSNLEYYLLDAAFAQDQLDKMKPLIEASLATFEIIPQPFTDEEKALEARTTELIRSAKLDSALSGERWYKIFLQSRKVGHMRSKMTQSEGMYSFETELRNDFGEGNTDATVVRGSFSPDGKVQKVETEENKVNPKQKWTFKATATIQSGQAKISRDCNGVKEEKSFTVEDGVLLNDVAEWMRSVLVGAGKGNYLLKSLSPYVEEWKVEMVDVGGVENLEIDGRTRPTVLVQAYVGRRRNMTFFYGTDRTVFRVGGNRELFQIKEATKEEALK